MGCRCVQERPLTTFVADASAALGGPPWLARRRAAAAARLADLALPTEAEEVWRYSGIDHFSLDAFAPSADPASAPVDLDGLLRRLEPFGDRSGLVVTVNGTVAHVQAPTGDDVSLSLAGHGVLAAQDESTGDPGHDDDADDAFGVLHDAFVSDVVAISVAKATVRRPLIVVHVVDGALSSTGAAPAVFSDLRVDVGPTAQVSVLELFLDGGPSGAPALVVPRTRLSVGDGAQLAYGSIQLLGSGATSIARQVSAVGRDASLSSFSVGLGGAYARVRTDSALVGAGGRTSLLAAYLGTSTQIHDFRTLQDHQAPRTDSELLFMGAVADTARSVYSGLIRIKRGARRADARQTNKNLVLSEGAHADSVPNLDIDDNDVRCSHASTVGPIDEEQRYYLESRGVEPSDAERLIVLGFFRSLAERAPLEGVRQLVEDQVADRLSGRLPAGAPS